MSDEISCPQCGGTNPANARFCRSCRRYLGAKPAAAAAPAPASAPAPPPVASTERIGADPEAPAVDPTTVEVPASAIDPRTPPPKPARPAPSPEVAAVPPATQVHEVVKPQAAPSAPLEPGAGQIRCPECGTVADANQRFCRFGHPLVDLSQPQPPPGAPSGATQAAPSGDGMRRASTTTRVAYDKGLTVRAKVARVAIIAGAFGIGISMLPPWGTDVRSFATDQVERVLPDEFETVPVEADENPADVQGFPAAFAVDGEPSRAWATGWLPGATVSQECGAGASGAAFTVRSSTGIDAERITVHNGLADDNPNVGKHATPKLIDVVVADGECTRIELAEEPDPQSHSVDIKGAEQITVVVADIYPAKAGDSTTVSLSEIEFEQKS